MRRCLWILFLVVVLFPFASGYAVERVHRDSSPLSLGQSGKTTLAFVPLGEAIENELITNAFDWINRYLPLLANRVLRNSTRRANYRFPILGFRTKGSLFSAVRMIKGSPAGPHRLWGFGTD